MKTTTFILIYEFRENLLNLNVSLTVCLPVYQKLLNYTYGDINPMTRDEVLLIR